MTITVTKTVTNELACFKLKASNFAITCLQLLDIDFSHLDSQIAEHVSKAPKFFDNTPIIIDCQIIADKPGLPDLNELISRLRSYNMIPIGLRGGRPEHQQLAKQAGLALFRPNKNPEKPVNLKPSPSEQKVLAKIIEQPIRSGQQVYAQGCDLIVLGSVSAGAECLADGNIHIYGALRGRALAGVLGNRTARIFCNSLEAELVSIAGEYQVSEVLKEGIWQAAANIYLGKENLQIARL